MTIYTLIYTEVTTDMMKTLRVLKQGLNIVIMPAACTLFFIQVSTVYRHNKHITIFFGFGWVVTLGLFVLGGVGHCFAWHSSLCELFFIMSKFYFDRVNPLEPNFLVLDNNDIE